MERYIYDLSRPGRVGVDMPDPDVPLTPLPEEYLREELPLPEVSENRSRPPLRASEHAKLLGGYRILPPWLLHDEVQSQGE